jgi:hypothetical protein
LVGETEVFGENLLQCRFVHHKYHMLPDREPGPPRWEAATNRLSYGTAKSLWMETVELQLLKGYLVYEKNNAKMTRGQTIKEVRKY